VNEIEVLLRAVGEHQERLFEIARTVRAAHWADVDRAGIITYSRKVFIPLTRLCRDRCHYCTFATVPHKLDAPYLELDEVLKIAREGAAAGCKEALFTLGDRPEDRWDVAGQWLEERGYRSTLDYVRACAIAVLEETGLLPHLNPGVLSWEEIQRLKPVAPSMGMMLETTSTKIWSEKGGAHFGSPDKEPAVRLQTLHAAGRSAVPFTTGLLIGIGETIADRAESLFELRKIAKQYGNVQEIIVQNFRAKPGTAMQSMPDADLVELARTIAVARIVLPAGVSVQAPPNLVGTEHQLIISAGIDDWGGVSPVTPDHVNPERPWPEIEALAEQTALSGFSLRERLTAYPKYVRNAERWIDIRLHPHVRALAAVNGLANETAKPVGVDWQEPEASVKTSGRSDLHELVDTVGRLTDRRGDFESVYGDWDTLKDKVQADAGQKVAPVRIADEVKAGLRLAERNPQGLLDPANATAALALITAEDADLAEVIRLADAARKAIVGDEITYIVNRNINFSNVCYVGCRFCAFAQRERDADAYRLSIDEVTSRAQEAWDVGATEIVVQGGIDPKLPVSYYADLVRTVKHAVPKMHVHAFSPMEIVSAASKAGVTVREWLTELKAAGLDTIPGTAAEILDDDVRWVLTKGKLPAATWVDVVSTAHELGIRSSSTMMYGHVDHPGHWIGHMRVLANIQRKTGGFTEFVGLPFVHRSAPIYLAGVARPGPSHRDNLAVHAFARLAFSGLIDNIQSSWVKLGDAAMIETLNAGVNDIGGTLMEETISRMAGADNGSNRSVDELRALARAAGRPVVQRSTCYEKLRTPRLRS
jgi:FO synthase